MTDLSEFIENSTYKGTYNNLGNIDIELRSKKVYWFVKRTFDILCSTLALTLLSPLLLIIALAIYIDDPHGSPIFVQNRCGRNGKIFSFYKFRTMVVNAEDCLDSIIEQNEMDGPVFKIKDDPRITNLGKFLRKTSIDELPQLWNVVKGDMSVVGPRPPLPREVGEYNAYQLQRLYIIPGLTCIWQTTPHRNDLSFDEWVALDVQYIKQRSWYLDLKIIFKTIKVMLTAQGR